MKRNGIPTSGAVMNESNKAYREERLLVESQIERVGVVR